MAPLRRPSSAVVPLLLCALIVAAIIPASEAATAEDAALRLLQRNMARYEVSCLSDQFRQQEAEALPEVRKARI